MTFELGVYSFGNTPRLADGRRGPTDQALRDVLEAINLADEVELDHFGVGEHHMRAMPLSSWSPDGARRRSRSRCSTTTSTPTTCCTPPSSTC